MPVHVIPVEVFYMDLALKRNIYVNAQITSKDYFNSESTMKYIKNMYVKWQSKDIH